MMAVNTVSGPTENPSPRTMKMPATKVAPGSTTCTPEAVTELQARTMPLISGGEVIVTSRVQTYPSQKTCPN